MSAAVLNDLPIAPDVIEVNETSLLGVRKQSGSLGSRLVGITTIFGVIALTIILGHALFNARLKTQVVEISRLDQQIALQEESVRELRLRYENAVAPLKIERVAYGQLALLPAESATQIRLRSGDIALNRGLGFGGLDEPDNAKRFSLDQVLAEAVTFDSSRNSR